MDDFASFARLVHEAYAHLHDRAYLQDHPLTQTLYGATSHAAERLHRTLIDAIEWLRPLGTAAPSSVEWRRYRHLQLRYIEGASPDHITRELCISPRQGRRDHVEALDEVARMLWKRIARAESASPVNATPASVNPGSRRTERSSASLDAELANLAARASSTPTDLNEVISGVVATVGRLADSRGVQIAIEIDQPLKTVAVSRTVLRQLLLSLLSESITRYSGGVLRVSANGCQHSVDIGVDVGLPRGAPPLNLTDDDLAGALELTRRLAASQAVSLSLASTPRGATARLTLPVFQVKTVLLVDDNPDVALLFRRFLADTSYRLAQARSAERALRLARELLPDLVVLDVLMPSHDGWEILQALRAEPETAALPVVICSVLPDHALARSLGVTEFLPKPVTRAALLQVLERVDADRERGECQDQPESIASAHQPVSHRSD